MEVPTDNDSPLYKTLYNFVQPQAGQDVELSYFGEVSQDTIKLLATQIEQSLTAQEENIKVIKRIYNVIIETLQNIRKHSDDPVTGMETDSKMGGIFIVENEDHYALTTVNAVSPSKSKRVCGWLDEINALDEDGVKMLYRKRIREGTISEKGGAGLGFIDMTKKNKNRFFYDVNALNENVNSLILFTKVSKL